MDKRKVSVIIPVYNVEMYLDRCITSVINQTYTELEIVLVDDGSADGSLKICEYYAKTDERIVVIHQENKGLSAARNKGIACCGGEFVTFLDSDDFLRADMIEKLFQDIQMYHADMSVCECERGGNDFFSSEFGTKENVSIVCYSGREIFENLFNNHKEMTIISCAKLYNKEIFCGYSFPLGVIHEDEYVIHHVLGKCNRVVYHFEKMYYHFLRYNSITQSDFSMRRLDVLAAFEDRFAFFEKMGDRELSLACKVDYMKRVQFLYYSILKYFPENKSKAYEIKKRYQEIYNECKEFISIGRKIRYGLFLWCPRGNYAIKSVLGAQKV